MDKPFVSQIPYDTARIGAAAVYCSDGRWGEQMDEFLHRGLGLPRYDRVAMPGGAACLASYIRALHERLALDRQLRFLVEVHELKRVVLIAHEGCAFYKQIHVKAQSVEQQQYADLAKAIRYIREYNVWLDVSAYFARKVGSKVQFEHVPG